MTTDRPSLDTILPPEMRELRWRPLMTFFLDITPPYNLGKTATADRRIAALPGGYFEGERLRGTVLPSGSDWQVVRTDGAWVIDVRTLLQTDDGALIGLRYQGLRHGDPKVLAAIASGAQVSPLDYYMRITTSFETSSEKYDWLNRVIAVAHGHRLQNGAIYNVFEII